MKKHEIAISIFTLIPKNLISRIVGYAAGLRLPQFFMNLAIKSYSARFNVKAEYITPPGGFKNFDAFFTREINRDFSSVSPHTKNAASPVDGRIDQYGSIRKSTLIQAKGIAYSLFDLIPSATANKFINGAFMTLYLAPGDYHRIHSPVSGTIIGYFNIPGKLFTVQDYMAKSLAGLFVKNERIITYIQSNAGSIAMCKIGALNVGKISLSYTEVSTNRLLRRRQEVFFNQKSHVPVRACGEIGIFHLGSTVILLFQKDAITFKNFNLGTRIRVGETIGSLHFIKKK